MSEVSSRTDCERADRLTERSFQAPLDGLNGYWLKKHLSRCSRCVVAADAVGGTGQLWHELDSHAPSGCAPLHSQVRTDILAHLSGQPVAALPLGAGYRVSAAFAGLAMTALVLIFFGLRPDFGQQPWILMAVPAAVLAGGFIIAISLFDALPNKLPALLGVASAAVAVLVVFLAANLLVEPVLYAGASGEAFWAHILGCEVVGTTVALSALFPAVFFARRTLAGPTRWGAVVLGMMSGGLAVGALHLGCSVVEPVHLTLGHGTVFLTGIILALLLRRARWLG